MVLSYQLGDNIYYRKNTWKGANVILVTFVNGSRPTHADAQYQNEAFPELDHYHPRLLPLWQGYQSTIAKRKNRVPEKNFLKILAQNIIRTSSVQGNMISYNSNNFHFCTHCLIWPPVTFHFCIAFQIIFIFVSLYLQWPLAIPCICIVFVSVF